MTRTVNGLLLLALAGCTQAPLVPPPVSQGGSSRLAAEVSYESKLAEVERKAAQVKIGMTRAEVELLFREHDGGIQGPTVSRYYEHPEVMIEIPFDQTAGNWSKANRVTGPPKVYRSRMHID